MSKGKDTGSWAAQQVQSLPHMLMLYTQASNNLKDIEQILLNQHGVTMVVGCPNEISTNKLISTGTQSASDRSAKPALVGSIPTLCSRVKCPDCTLCCTVEITSGVYHCMGCEATFLDEKICESPGGTAEINQQGNVQDAGVPKAKPAGRVQGEPMTVFTSEVLEANKLTRVRVSAVVLVWNQDFTKLLMGKRKIVNKQGLWVIPGGKVEFGQSLSYTAKREILEETGLVVNLLSDDPICVREIIDEETHRILVYYEGYPIGGALQAHSDLDEVEFLGPEEVKALPLTDLTKNVIMTADPEFVQF